MSVTFFKFRVCTSLHGTPRFLMPNHTVDQALFHTYYHTFSATQVLEACAAMLDNENTIEFAALVAAQHQNRAVQAVAHASKDMGERIVHLEQSVAQVIGELAKLSQRVDECATDDEVTTRLDKLEQDFTNKLCTGVTQGVLQEIDDASVLLCGERFQVVGDNLHWSKFASPVKEQSEPPSGNSHTGDTPLSAPILNAAPVVAQVVRLNSARALKL